MSNPNDLAKSAEEEEKEEDSLEWSSQRNKAKINLI